MVETRPVLVFGYGNPSRGDDALGPLAVERIAGLQRQGRFDTVELVTDFQLQIEHVLDLQHRELVVFIDVAENGAEPFSFEAVVAEQDPCYSTHAMSPAALLRVFEQVMQSDPSATYLLAIRGYRFELGSTLTDAARDNLDAAVQYLIRRLGGGQD